MADLTPDSSRMPPESPFSPERAGRYQGNGGGLGWKHGNPGHRRRARPTPATFTRSGAGHQDGGGNPGHRRGPSAYPAKGWLGALDLFRGLLRALHASRFQRKRRFQPVLRRRRAKSPSSRPQSTTAGCAGDSGLSRRRRRQPWPPKRARFPAFTRATRRVGLKTRQPWPPETGKADASDIHPLRRWPPGRRWQPWPPSTGKIPSVHQGNGGGLGWKHGNPGHRRRARPTPAMFTRSGAGHQDGGGNPGHRNRPDSERSPGQRRRVGLETRQPLATIDGQGRRQRHSPAPALATGDGGGNPWPPSTGKADASDVHPLRRWPPETAAATLATETGQIPSVHQGNGGGLGWKHGNPWPPSTGKADASDIHPLRRWPPETAAATLGHHRRARPTPAMFTRSGAGHQDGGGNPGHHRRARFPAFTRATAAGWAENTATLATIDGQGRRQRHSPAPALATIDGGGNPGHRNRPDSERSPGQRRRVGLETRQPWPPSTGKADASDIHPLRRWPPGRRRPPETPAATLATETGKVPSVHQGNAAGWVGNTATLATGDGQGRRQRHSPFHWLNAPWASSPQVR